MIDSDDVLLLKPMSGAPELTHGGDAGGYVIVVAPFATTPTFEDWCASDRGGDEPIAAYVTEPSANTFPALPAPCGVAGRCGVS